MDAARQSIRKRNRQDDVPPSTRPRTNWDADTPKKQRIAGGGGKLRNRVTLLRFYRSARIAVCEKK
jgi:hypothetical protein